MELRHLRYFVAIAEEKSFTRAAERLGLQQPPLSQQIKALESEMGFALFKRIPKGVELTAGGAVFLQEARDILARLERGTAHAARAAQGLEGALSIGLTSSASTHRFAPSVLHAFRETYPGVDLTLKDGNAADLTDGVLDRRLDLAIIRVPVSHPAGLVFHTLVREEMLAVLPAAHPLAKAATGRVPTISLKALAGEPFILVRRPGAPGLYAELIEACERAGFSPTIAAEVGNMMTNVTLVAAGMGVSVVPASMRGIHAESVAYCRLAKSTRLLAPITLVHRRDDPNPAVGRFAALARQVVAKTAGESSG